MPLSRRVLCVVDLPCGAGAEGLRLAALRAGDAACAHERSVTEVPLDRFLELVAKPDSISGALYCYGEDETAAALEMGAVEILLLAPSVSGRTAAQWRALAAAHNTEVVEVEDSSDKGTSFCQSYGVGGCLRWPVSAELLDEPEHDDEKIDVLGEMEQDAEFTTNIAPQDMGSPSRAGAPLQKDALAWLEAALNESLEDAASAEALTACAEVLLADESADMCEVITQTVDMLLGEGVQQSIVDQLCEKLQ